MLTIYSPYITGYAVYQARAMESLWNGNVQYDDNTNCGLPSQRYAQYVISSQPLKSKPQVTIQPNPAFLQVLFTCTEHVEGSISIVDVLGKSVINQEMSGTTVELNVSKLNQGMYHYIIRNNSGNIIYFGKLSVTR